MYRKRIPLYFSSERIQRNKDFDNFGDLLSGEVVQFVSGNKFQWTSPRSNLLKRPVLFAIGSIIRKSRGRCFVWGSGIKFPEDKIHPDTVLYAVRGKYTLESALKQGCKTANSNVAFGDPAVLSPLIWNYPVMQEYEYGIVPHFTHYKMWENVKLPDNMHLIDVTQTPEEAITEIRKCKRIISSSLHGLIVGHAYNIPSLWVRFSKDDHAIGNIKYNDYFSEMGIEEYEPLDMWEVSDNFTEIFENYFKENLRHSLHSIDLTKMQEDLINAFPPQYKR